MKDSQPTAILRAIIVSGRLCCFMGQPIPGRFRGGTDALPTHTTLDTRSHSCRLAGIIRDARREAEYLAKVAR